MSKDTREHAAGKGDLFRKVNKEEFDKNMDIIFGKKAKEVNHESK